RVLARAPELPPSDFVAAALDEARTRFRLEVPGVEVDSSALSGPHGKLGLGSSAATVAATLTAVLAHHGRAPRGDARVRLQVLNAALAAHARAQAARGAAGSGGDVATSVMGGLVAYQLVNGRTRAVHLDPALLAERLVFVATGQPASSAEMVRAVQTLRERSRSRYDMQLDSLRSCALAFLSALEASDHTEMIREFRRAGDAMAALGDAAGTPIVTAEHARVRALFDRMGGAAKPSGAGGGDLAVGLVPDPALRPALVQALTEAGLEVLPLALTEAGAQSEEPSA
ncbi:MAG TPA: hypothetical protein VFX50_08105, partial [Gemmatimonadales bacterium]|nr:hypothetical protein [Gemmatimonadales bacterium]